MKNLYIYSKKGIINILRSMMIKYDNSVYIIDINGF